MSTTREMAEIMLDAARGEPIESRHRSGLTDWEEDKDPDWNWRQKEYRIAPATPDEVNWDHIHPDFKYMARDASGAAHVFMSKPTVCGNFWDARGESSVARTHFLASYKQGNLPWDKSLVRRSEPKSQGDKLREEGWTIIYSSYNAPGFAPPMIGPGTEVRCVQGPGSQVQLWIRSTPQKEDNHDK